MVGNVSLVLLLALSLVLLVLTSGFTPLDDSNIQADVDQWVGNETAALAEFGRIEDWDTSLVTVMNWLFAGKQTFNADISKWVVSKVTSFTGTFAGTTAFNQVKSANAINQSETLSVL